jgi:two-component system response regulator YesN
MILSSIDNTSRDSVIESILCYINRNYKENLKLETISPLFGYNSSYLGKVFNARLGETFNTYLDRLRIENSLSLLELDSLKIYEVAEKVGYCSVDYFDIKFKKFMGVSPKEYRKQLRGRQQ